MPVWRFGKYRPNRRFSLFRLFRERCAVGSRASGFSITWYIDAHFCSTARGEVGLWRQQLSGSVCLSCAAAEVWIMSVYGIKHLLVPQPWNMTCESIRPCLCFSIHKTSSCPPVTHVSETLLFIYLWVELLTLLFCFTCRSAFWSFAHLMPLMSKQRRGWTAQNKWDRFSAIRGVLSVPVMNPKLWADCVMTMDSWTVIMIWWWCD